jgi:hypothetical protein
LHICSRLRTLRVEAVSGVVVHENYGRHGKFDI